MLTLMISSRNKSEYKEVVDTQGQDIIDCSITGNSFLSTLGGRESFLKHDIERSKTNNNEIRTNSFEEIMPNLKAEMFPTPGVSVPPNMRTFSDFKYETHLHLRLF